MAEFSNEESTLPEYKPNSVFNQLRRLFSTDVIIRNVGGEQLKVADTNQIQMSGELENNSLMARYNRIYTTSPTSL